MAKNLSLLSLTVLAALVAGCASPHAGVLPTGGQVAPQAGSPAPVSTASPPPGSPGAPPAAPEAAVRTILIRAISDGAAFAGAAVNVRLVSDLSLVADGLVLDTQGRIPLPLTSKLSAGTTVVVTAERDGQTLSGLFTVPAAAFAVMQSGAAPGSVEWLLDLATSAVTRKLTSKVADVLRSLPPSASAAAVQSLMDRVEALVRTTRETLASSTALAGIQDALQRATTQPTSANIENLANRLIVDTPLRSSFVTLVTDINRQVFDNMVAGGPLVIPARWEIYGVVVEPPQLRVLGPDQVEISFGNTRQTRNQPGAQAALDSARRASTSTQTGEAFAPFNNTVVSSGGGSGGGGAAPAPTISLSGKVQVGGIDTPRAVVQLRTYPGNVRVATVATDANGDYAFSGIEDGQYYLIVAVDGAVQETRIVTIGTPLQ